MVSTDKVVQLIEAAKQNDTSLLDRLIRELIFEFENRGRYKAAKKLRELNALPTSTSKSVNPEPSSNLQSSSLGETNDSKLYQLRYSKATLEDIVLNEEARIVFNEVVDTFTKRELLQQNHVNIENKLLLYGPPGTGKTLFAYVLAGHLNIPVMHVYLDALISSYLGETGKNIRAIFNESKNTECVILLDEFDSIAKKRDDSTELGELKRVVSVLLQNIDELSPRNILVGATNHDHLLDSAIRRRFVYQLNLDIMDESSRIKLLQLLLPNQINVDLSLLTEISDGLTGAAVKLTVDKALRNWVLHNKQPDFNEVLVHYMASEYFANHNINLKKKSEAKFFAQIVSKLRKFDINKYTFKYLEELTKIPDSTINRVVNQYEY